ncbi:hypothetical protein SLS58_008016 [Diplodia intermedia]|uniref:Uncharacterized protein n=1 Tax=Diplodia intermedia TaxID=856260 RepID=A0ABR3TII1_9PEZI
MDEIERKLLKLEFGDGAIRAIAQEKHMAKSTELLLNYKESLIWDILLQTCEETDDPNDRKYSMAEVLEEYMMTSKGSTTPPTTQQMTYEKTFLRRLAELRRRPEFRWVFLYRGDLLNATLRKLPTLKGFGEKELFQWAAWFSKAYKQVHDQAQTESQGWLAGKKLEWMSKWRLPSNAVSWHIKHAEMHEKYIDDPDMSSLAGQGYNGDENLNFAWAVITFNAEDDDNRSNEIPLVVADDHLVCDCALYSIDSLAKGSTSPKDHSICD